MPDADIIATPDAHVGKAKSVAAIATILALILSLRKSAQRKSAGEERRKRRRGMQVQCAAVRIKELHIFRCCHITIRYALRY